MKFEIVRDLTNKVFTTSVNRKFVQDDPEDVIEAGLENDFGPVKVEIGTIFSGFINKAADGTFSADIVSNGGVLNTDYIPFKFGLTANEVALTKTSQLVYKCDAKLESPIVFSAGVEITALKVAELKCQLFEKTAEDRITKAVDAWKKEATGFEKTVPADTFTVSLQ